MKIAVIGAGVAGLTFSKLLRDRADVVVFDKSRGVSGRTSTRYAGDFEFDHGVQYFTVKSDEFKNFLSPYIDLGVVKEWSPRVIGLDDDGGLIEKIWKKTAYVGSPRMNSLSKAIAADLDIRLNHEVVEIFNSNSKSKWDLAFKDGAWETDFDWVVCTAPAPQSLNLMPLDFSDYEKIKSSKMLGCYSLMLGLKEGLNFNWDVAEFGDCNSSRAIGWVAVNSTKPDRPEGFSLLIQTTNSWAEKNIELDKEWVTKVIKAEFAKTFEIDVAKLNSIISYESLHRWRYASCASSSTNAEGYLLDKKNQLAICSDWCISSRVESAFLSAYNLVNNFQNYV